MDAEALLLARLSMLPPVTHEAVGRAPSPNVPLAGFSLQRACLLPCTRRG